MIMVVADIRFVNLFYSPANQRDAGAGSGRGKIGHASFI
jgi:hypothetical protein